MKILLLCWRDSTHPQGGGSERYLERVGQYLASRGHEVTFRTAKHMNAARRETKDGIHFSRGGGKFDVYPRALAFIARHTFDVIIDTQNGIPFFAKAITRTPTVLLTHHCHKEQWPVAGPVLGRLGWFLESKVAPWVYRSAPYVTVSEASRQDLAGLGITHAQIIANGLDPIPEHLPKLEREAPVHLVTLSRLVPNKQIEHAIDIVRQIPGAQLDIIGSGWWEHNLREYARGANVRFHGQVTEDYKHALLELADVHLMPSRKEGWGLAVMEANQHALPTVGYTFGLRDSVRHNETGLLGSSPAELLEHTRTLVNDRQLRERLGTAGQQWAAEFSWDKTGAQWEELLRKQG